jgi:hypothetical protein
VPLQVTLQEVGTPDLLARCHGPVVHAAVADELGRLMRTSLFGVHSSMLRVASIRRPARADWRVLSEGWSAPTWADG